MNQFRVQGSTDSKPTICVFVSFLFFQSQLVLLQDTLGTAIAASNLEAFLSSDPYIIPDELIEAQSGESGFCVALTSVAKGLLRTVENTAAGLTQDHAKEVTSLLIETFCKSCGHLVDVFTRNLIECNKEIIEETDSGINLEGRCWAILRTKAYDVVR